ncbi:hypothetical protein BGX23_010156 [Mortierella sp. AD031]|nr:hypothetical protein BGX23_010156 [Mortierella sp. AD031]
MSFDEKLPAYTASSSLSSQPTTTFARPKANKICCITLRDADKILLINTPLQVIRSIRLAILESWYQPTIQSEGDYYGGYEFKVKGNPWRGFRADSVYSRKLVLGILRRMEFLGWRLIQSSDVTKSRCELDSLFFEHIKEFKGRRDGEENGDGDEMDEVEDREVKLEIGQDMGTEMFAVTFEWWDRLRVIEGSPENIAAIKDALETVWTKGIQLEKDYAGSYEFKLGGSPFNPWKWDSIQARMMFIQILANLKAQGFSLYASIDISPNCSKDDEKIESWFFMQDKVREGAAETRGQLTRGGGGEKTGILVDF